MVEILKPMIRNIIRTKELHFKIKEFKQTYGLFVA